MRWTPSSSGRPRWTPERRTLRQVEISDMTEVDRVVNELMGNDVECRRTFITEHAADIDERFLDI